MTIHLYLPDRTRTKADTRAFKAAQERTTANLERDVAEIRERRKQEADPQNQPWWVRTA